MSKTAERNLWRWTAKGNKGRPLLHMERVENGAGLGTPDVEGCLSGHGFHIELKTTKRPARESTLIRVSFRPAQVPWLERRWSVGGAAWVLVQVGSGHAASRYLIPGDHAAVVAAGVTETELWLLSAVDPDASAEAIIDKACIRS